MSPLSLNQIGQIHINVKDVDRATAFYKDVLGMPHLFQVPSMSFFDCGGIMLMLGIPTSAEFNHPSSIIYYQVADIAAMHKTLVERGVSFTEVPNFVANMGEQDLWMGFFQDTEGNTLAIRSLVPKGTKPA
jgi:predicted enzyme related to lactoylglutathione lyase